MSHNEQILAHLKSGKTITQEEAIDNFRCFRLSGRIYDLRERGHDIQSHMVEVNNKRFARYRLVQHG